MKHDAKPWEISGLNILIVENDSITAGILNAMVRKNGHSGMMASNGQKALQHAEQSRFEMAFVDCFLPDIEPHSLIRNLHRLQPMMAIVAMAEQNFRELELKIRQQGIIYFMLKPFEGVLLDLLLTHVGRRFERRPGQNLNKRGV